MLPYIILPGSKQRLGRNASCRAKLLLQRFLFLAATGLTACDGAWPRLTWDAVDSYFDTRDTDGDGWPDCDQGYSAASCDCEDAEPDINPVALEVCDTLDNNCNDEIDEETPLYAHYLDTDSDGHGAQHAIEWNCHEALEGYARIQDDCDDADSSIHPGATEQCNGKDDDCDQSTDEDFGKTTFYGDADGDGYGNSTCAQLGCQQVHEDTSSCPSNKWSTLSDDCDDTNPNIYPGAKEPCLNDGIDYDCDGKIVLDADDDGYLPCEENPDCDDSDADIHPGAEELCDAIDNDCDGNIDALDYELILYEDSDGDGWGHGDPRPGYSCPGEGSSLFPDDCDDEDDAIYPGQDDTCDGLDNNCDGQIDEGLTQYTLYPDNDQDGYGSWVEAPTITCHEPTQNQAKNDDDCDDNNNTIYPDAPESCNSHIDSDCNGTPGNDRDGDGYCEPYDCNDWNADINPGAIEGGCDDADNDCDNSTNDKITSHYPDCDEDGWGDKSAPALNVVCAEGDKTDDGCSYVTDEYQGPDVDCEAPGVDCQATDCNDWQASIHPGAQELCDGIDHDCDDDINDCLTEALHEISIQEVR